MKRVVIVGNGVAGITAARHIRKLDSTTEISIIGSETKHFFSRTALMYVFMGHMKFEHTKPYADDFWAKNRLDLIYGHVLNIDFDNKIVHYSNNKSIAYSSLILALGSKPVMLPWPGNHLQGVQGLYSCQDLMTLEENVKGIQKAAVLGGGLIGIELVEMLRSRNIDVTFFIREDHYWGNILSSPEGNMLMNHMEDHGVRLITQAYVTQFIEGQEGRVSGVEQKNGNVVDAEFVGVTVGVEPNVSFLKESSIHIDRGIVVDEYMRTNIQDVYAIGDCAQFKTPIAGRSAVEQVWYTGKIMGSTVAKTICGEETPYQPGNWFNSAKFFDIEYQTYGAVPVEVPVGHSNFFWKAEGKNVAFRLVFDANSQRFLGINVFGIRLRHDAIDRWLTEQKEVDYVMAHLKDASFNPEFSKDYFPFILDAFNQQFNKNINLKTKSWKRILSFSA